MKRSLFLCLFIIAFVLGSSWNAQAQKATEIYIPIGQSPGLSGQYAKIGTVSSIDETAASFVISDSLNNTHPVMITDSTQIWLDCTLIKEPNVKGSLSDIRDGILVEVKFHLASDSTYTNAADWIKVQITEHME